MSNDKQLLKKLFDSIEWHNLSEKQPPYADTMYLILQEIGEELSIGFARFDGALWYIQDDKSDFESWCGPVKYIKKWAKL